MDDKGVTASIILKPDAIPIFKRYRPVPLPMTDAVNNELHRLECQGIITPTSHFLWASPVVWVSKSDGSLRLCADFKGTLNPQILPDAYPLPSIEEIFSKLAGSIYFAKIDLQTAYSQVPLDENSRLLSVINTTKGLYTINRLQMGMRNSSAIFQRFLENNLGDIPGIAIYQDDILVHGMTKVILDERLSSVKEKLKQLNMTINWDKSITHTESIDYLGYTIDKNGIKPDSKNHNRILQAKEPTNLKELESFMGLANFYGRMIPCFSEITIPLNNLRRDDVAFVWSEECQKAFDELKTKLTSSPILVPYDVSKDVILTNDASKDAIGGILSQDGRLCIKEIDQCRAKLFQHRKGGVRHSVVRQKT